MTTPIPAGLELPDTSHLALLQTHMAAMCRHFAWDGASNTQTFMMLAEEVGELAKAMRNADAFLQEIGKAKRSEAELRANLAEEFADVFSYLLDLANRYGIDLGRAYADKTAHNFGRSWK